MGQADKLERLMNLVAALLETRRPLTRAELHRRVPGYPDEVVSFRRAFERDKDDLREMGIPFVVEEVPGTDPPATGYRIPKDQYYLRDPGLEPDEVAALHLAAQAVRLDGIEGAGALWKLGGVPAGGRSETESRPADVTALPADPNLVALFRAVGERRQVTFDYHGTRRTVDPYRLDFMRGRWYVSGYDHVRADERNFRLDRVVGAVETGPAGAFGRPESSIPGARRAPWQLGEGDGVVARLLVDPVQAAVARSAVGAGATIDELDDGSVIIAMSVTNRAGFLSFVLGFLDHAEVLDPPELRREITEWLESVAAVAPTPQ